MKIKASLNWNFQNWMTLKMLTLRLKTPMTETTFMVIEVMTMMVIRTSIVNKTTASTLNASEDPMPHLAPLTAASVKKGLAASTDCTTNDAVPGYFLLTDATRSSSFRQSAVNVSKPALSSIVLFMAGRLSHRTLLSTPGFEHGSCKPK